MKILNTQLSSLRLAFAAVIVAASASTFAAPIALAGFSGSESVIDFSVLNDAPGKGPFTLGVATFSQADRGNGGAFWRLFEPGSSGNTATMLVDGRGITELAIDFASSYDRVGFYVAIGTATYVVDFYDGDTLLGSESVFLPDLDSQFVGFENLAGGVSRAVIREISGDNRRIGGLWNIHYEDVADGNVPEPSNIGLALIALAGVAAARRNRRA